MTPFYFGSGSRRLFGLYTPARVGAVGNRAVVLCPAWGQEYLCAHRSMRQLANMLNAAGFHVLRFDYFGTGDSAGDMTQGDLGGWEADIDTAIEELKDTCGALRVALVGLRMGGTLAARVAARRTADVDALILWDPVVDGCAYKEEIMRMGEQDARELGRSTERAADQGGGHEVLGFPLTERLAEDFGKIDLAAQIGSVRARTAVVVSRPLAADSALAAALASGAGQPARTIELIESQAAWINDDAEGAGAVPVKVLQRIVQCLA
ncbi:MAG: alpha/beta fold hydrolase [Rhodocyclales bacterium]|nr:alpha/beta fold hydrolase [Rhodocyclales bacterium]